MLFFFLFFFIFLFFILFLCFLEPKLILNMQIHIGCSRIFFLDVYFPLKDENNSILEQSVLKHVKLEIYS